MLIRLVYIYLEMSVARTTQLLAAYIWLVRCAYICIRSYTIKTPTYRYTMSEWPHAFFCSLYFLECVHRATRAHQVAAYPYGAEKRSDPAAIRRSLPVSIVLYCHRWRHTVWHSICVVYVCICAISVFRSIHFFVDLFAFYIYEYIYTRIFVCIRTMTIVK